MPTDLPFTGVVNRFITYFSSTEDLARAAIMTGLTFTKAKALYRTKEIREEIDRRLDKIHEEQAILFAKAAVLSEHKLDAALLECVDAGVGIIRVRAVELGYKKMGLLKDKVEHSGADGGPVVFTYERIGKKE